MYVDSFSNYDEMYKEKYKKFIEIIDDSYYRSVTYISTTKYFKKVNLENAICNLKFLNEASPLDNYRDINKNIPALIISAGPSLDENIEDLKKYKHKLNNFFIVAGNRTVKSLMDNGIRPDVVISIDPQEITYNMLKPYLNENIPLVYYEQSSGRLVNEYMGNKIYTTQGLYKNIEELSFMQLCYSGGSVAHCSTDIAVILGCNPIIFLGQDFAFKDHKHHAHISSLSIDKEINENNIIMVEDVFGNEIQTDKLLNLYRKNLEYYIKVFNNITFINASKGAKILGTLQKNLKNLLNDKKYKNGKMSLSEKKIIKVDTDKIYESLLKDLNKSMEKAKIGIKLCSEILTNEDPYEVNVYKLDYVLKSIDEFILNKNNVFFKSYLEDFLFEVKEKYFKMPAKDYKNLSGDLLYQSNIFSSYLKDMISIMEEVKNIIIKNP